MVDGNWDGVGVGKRLGFFSVKVIRMSRCMRTWGFAYAVNLILDGGKVVIDVIAGAVEPMRLRSFYLFTE